MKGCLIKYLTLALLFRNYQDSNSKHVREVDTIIFFLFMKNKSIEMKLFSFLKNQVHCL